MGLSAGEHMTHANNSTHPLCSHFLFNFLFFLRNSQEKVQKRIQKELVSLNTYRYSKLFMSYQLWNTEKKKISVIQES